MAAQSSWGPSGSPTSGSGTTTSGSTFSVASILKTDTTFTLDGGPLCDDVSKDFVLCVKDVYKTGKRPSVQVEQCRDLTCPTMYGVIHIREVCHFIYSSREEWYRYNFNVTNAAAIFSKICKF